MRLTKPDEGFLKTGYSSNQYRSLPDKHSSLNELAALSRSERRPNEALPNHSTFRRKISEEQQACHGGKKAIREQVTKTRMILP